MASRSSVRAWTPRTRRSSRRSRGTAWAAGSSWRCAATSGSAPTMRKLGQPEIKLGLIPGGGGTQRLPRLVGMGRAMLLNLTGEFVDAATAERWGLVEKIVPRGGAPRCRARGGEGDRGQVAARRRGAARARADDARPSSGRRAAPRSRRVPALPRQRGRPGRRERVHREARAAIHRPVRAVPHEPACNRLLQAHPGDRGVTAA